jgi:hypothetical protein
LSESEKGQHAARRITTPDQAVTSPATVALTTNGDEFFDLTCIGSRLLAHHPAFLPDLVIGVEFASQIPQVLARMIEIDDLNGTGKVLVGDVPDPFGSIFEFVVGERANKRVLIIRDGQHEYIFTETA